MLQQPDHCYNSRRIWVLGFGLWGLLGHLWLALLRNGVQGLGFRVWGLGFRV